jgi:hypothetical protein
MVAMFRKKSATVRLTLNGRPTRVKRLGSRRSATRRFYLAMESKWMDLAASTAVVERVDLLLESTEFRFRLSPSDLCPASSTNVA